MRRSNNDYWLGRFAVEAAIALTALESKDEELARMTLKDAVEEFLEESTDAGLIEHVREMRLERIALTPVSIPYRSNIDSMEEESTGLTGAEIASRL